MEAWEADTEWRNATFSLAERDRRWGLVRGKMAERDMGTIVCLTTGDRHRVANARYLTQLDDGDEDVALVFPMTGEPTAWCGRAGHWPSSSWFSDIRGREGRSWGRQIAARLRELGLASTTIGVSGMRGSTLVSGRSPEGYTNYGAMLALQAELPGATFVDATELLGECRYAKSDEEVAFLERGTKVAEATLEALVTAARPGVPEREVFAAMLAANMRAGGSYPPMLAWTSGPAGHLYHRIEQPTLFRKVHEGDLLMPELTGRWGGYVAQIDPTIVIGQVPSEYEDAHQLAVESFNRILAAMRPGATPSDLVEAGEVTALGGRLRARVVCHGRGLGDDGPLIVNRVTPEVANIELVPGACFAVKPSVVLDDHEEASRFGDSVVVTATGARRLGTRSQELKRVQ